MVIGKQDGTGHLGLADIGGKKLVFGEMKFHAPQFSENKTLLRLLQYSYGVGEDM